MFNWTLLIGSSLLMILLSIYSMRAEKKKDDESGFLVAGNSLGPFVGAATIIATGYSGFVFIGSSGVTYEYGSYEVFASAFFTPAFLIAALFFGDSLRRGARELGSRTIPEYIARRHASTSEAVGSRAHRLLQGLSAAMVILLLSVFLITQLKAIGLLVSEWLDIPFNAAALLITLLVIGYTMFGGLKAVAWTDTVMVLGMVLGSCIIAWVVFGEVGIDRLIARLDAIDPELANPTTGAPYGESTASGYLLLPYAFLWATALPFMSVRFVAIRESASMPRVGIWIAILGLLLTFTPLAGLYTRAFAPELDNPDLAMPRFLELALSPAVSGVITLFILFAMKSTANSLMHTVSTAISYDLRAACRLDTPFLRSMHFNRLMVVLVGVGSFFAMAYLPPMMVLWLGFLGNGTLMAALFGVTLCSVFYPGNALGAFASIVAGFATCAGILLFTGLGWVQGPLYGCIASMLAYVLFSKLGQRRPVAA